MADEACGSLSDEQLKLFAGEFERLQHGKPVNGREELATLMRQVGLRPTEEELGEMIEDVPNPQKIDLPDFIILVYYFLRGTDSADDLIRAFSVFDADDSGKIPSDTARAVLTNLKHPVPDEQIDALLRELDEGGYIEIAKMIHKLKPT
jgi:Ca2+-binding EF-hand superfamily protein